MASFLPSTGRSAAQKLSAFLLIGILSPTLCQAGDRADADETADASMSKHDVLTLSDALAATLLRNPELSVFSLETRAREAETIQAGVRPNPELRGELENVAGSGSRKGADDSETTLLLSQPVQLGGKRAKRQDVAARRQTLSELDYESRRLSALTETRKAFVTTRVAQERVALAEELEALSRDALGVTERSVRAGASASMEVTRARVALGQAAIERSRATRALDAARVALAATWGDARPDFTRVAGEIDLPERLPEEEALIGQLKDNPDLARWESERGERNATLAFEQAQRVPDITVGAGPRYFNDSEDAALVFEIGVPLPIFNRNEGAIAAAQARVQKAAAEEQAAKVSVIAALRAAYSRLTSAHEQAFALREHVLADAEASRRGALEGYRSGGLRLLDVLDSQRTLFELRAQYLDVVEAFHLAAADIERLTARPLQDSPTAEAR